MHYAKNSFQFLRMQVFFHVWKVQCDAKSHIVFCWGWTDCRWHHGYVLCILSTRLFAHITVSWIQMNIPQILFDLWRILVEYMEFFPIFTDPWVSAHYWARIRALSENHKEPSRRQSEYEVIYTYTIRMCIIANLLYHFTMLVLWTRESFASGRWGRFELLHRIQKFHCKINIFYLEQRLKLSNDRFDGLCGLCVRGLNGAICIVFKEKFTVIWKIWAIIYCTSAVVLAA